MIVVTKFYFKNLKIILGKSWRKPPSASLRFPNHPRPAWRKIVPPSSPCSLLRKIISTTTHRNLWICSSRSSRSRRSQWMARRTTRASRRRFQDSGRHSKAQRGTVNRKGILSSRRFLSPSLNRSQNPNSPTAMPLTARKLSARRSKCQPRNPRCSKRVSQMFFQRRRLKIQQRRASQDCSTSNYRPNHSFKCWRNRKQWPIQSLRAIGCTRWLSKKSRVRRSTFSRLVTSTTATSCALSKAIRSSVRSRFQTKLRILVSRSSNRISSNTQSTWIHRKHLNRRLSESEGRFTESVRSVERWPVLIITKYSWSFDSFQFYDNYAERYGPTQADEAFIRLCPTRCRGFQVRRKNAEPPPVLTHGPPPNDDNTPKGFWDIHTAKSPEASRIDDDDPDRTLDGL